jgi:hypothetical protein
MLLPISTEISLPLAMFAENWQGTSAKIFFKPALFFVLNQKLSHFDPLPL